MLFNKISETRQILNFLRKYFDQIEIFVTYHSPHYETMMALVAWSVAATQASNSMYVG